MQSVSYPIVDDIGLARAEIYPLDMLFKKSIPPGQPIATTCSPSTVETAIETANSLIRVGYVEGRAKLGITYKNITSYSNSTAIINELARLGYEKRL